MAALLPTDAPWLLLVFTRVFTISFFFFLKKKKEVGKMFTLFFFFFKALFDRHATERDVKSTSSCLGEKKRE